MMFARLRLSSLLRELSRLGSRNGFASTFYSTTAVLSHSFVDAGKDPMELFRIISPVGDPRVSIVPILDQWIEEGRSVDKNTLTAFIKKLQSYKRYSHALEISMWMTDKRYFPPTPTDVAIRLSLISKVQGIEQVEKYFNNITQKFKGFMVYGALLNCYAYSKSVEKAEAIMQKMRDLGFARTPLPYNLMLNLYCKTGNIDKLNGLLHEMQDNGIVHDQFTFNILLSAFAAIDIDVMEKIVKRMESDPKVVLDWSTYSIAANGYTKAGLLDKAFEMLKNSEALVSGKQRGRAYCFLLRQYCAIKKKDETLRLWELYKKKEKVYNNGYLSILTSLLKLDDFETAEMIFDEWESQDLNYDIHIPNSLIGAYSRKGLFEKAETLFGRVISKGGQPDAWTWYNLATGYFQNDQPQKTTEEMMKKAVVLCGCRLKRSIESLAAIVKYLKREGDMQKAEEFVKLLQDINIISVEVKENLLHNI